MRKFIQDNYLFQMAVITLLDFFAFVFRGVKGKGTNTPTIRSPTYGQIQRIFLGELELKRLLWLIYDLD